jgi:hypothetical protein
MSAQAITRVNFPNFSLEVHYRIYPGERESRDSPGSDPELEISSCLLEYPAKIPGLVIDLQALDLLDEFGYAESLEAQLWEVYYDSLEPEEGE